MTTLDDFRTEVEDAIETLGVSPTNFGKEVAADPGFVFNLRAGREPRFSTIEKVRKRITGLLEDRPTSAQEGGAA